MALVLFFRANGACGSHEIVVGFVLFICGVLHASVLTLRSGIVPVCRPSADSFNPFMAVNYSRMGQIIPVHGLDLSEMVRCSSVMI